MKVYIGKIAQRKFPSLTNKEKRGLRTKNNQFRTYMPPRSIEVVVKKYSHENCIEFLRFCPISELWGKSEAKVNLGTISYENAVNLVVLMMTKHGLQDLEIIDEMSPRMEEGSMLHVDEIQIDDELFADV